MNFKKWLQAGLISLCTLALFGCAGLENALSTPITPEEVPIENGLLGILQKNELARIPVTASSVHNITKGNLYILLVATDSSLGRKVALANGFVEADPNGKVIKIVLGEVFVNKLFDADTMDASTFADQFVKFYNVPRMDVSSDWKSWVYMSEDGAKLSISDEKTLILEKKAGQKDLKKAFN